MIKQLLFSLFAISTLCTCNNKQPDSVDANEDWTITEYGVGIIQIESSISQIKKLSRTTLLLKLTIMER